MEDDAGKQTYQGAISGQMRVGEKDRDFIEFYQQEDKREFLEKISGSGVRAFVWAERDLTKSELTRRLE